MVRIAADLSVALACEKAPGLSTPSARPGTARKPEGSPGLGLLAMCGRK
jgi:hypothetical protein